MARRPTVEDVARAAGVSRQTVSNVMNAPDIVRAATRERVLKAVDALGYRAHASARRLRTQKSSTLGVRLDPHTDGISGAILDRFLHALTEQADAAHLRVLLFTAHDTDDEIRQFGRLLRGGDVDAFVLTSTFPGDPRPDWLIEHDAAFVTFGRPWGIPDLGEPHHRWVDVDGRAGVRAATRALLTQGMHTIGFLGWPRGSATGDDRARGWREALDTAGTAASAEDLREEAVDTVSAARRAFRRLRARVGHLDALVTASDSLALGAYLETRGTLPVVGFDNTPVSKALDFSSIDQRPKEVARHVLASLSDMSATTASTRLVTPRLVLRDAR